jgi:hypothetical protein
MTTTTITKQNDLITYANGEWAHFQLDGTILASLPHNSTAIEFWYYNLSHQMLVVQYKSSETYYHYDGVPFSVIFDLMLADSLGAFIAKEVKPNYSVA